MSKFIEDLRDYGGAFHGIRKDDTTTSFSKEFLIYDNQFDYMVEHYVPEFKQTTTTSEVKHYAGSVEPIDLIESQQLNFNRGNIIKYVSRAGKKDSERDDLQKALWYLEREIGNLDEK